MMRSEGVPIDDGHGDVPASRGSKGPDVGHDASEERSGCHDVERPCVRQLNANINDRTSSKLYLNDQRVALQISDRRPSRRLRWTEGRTRGSQRCLWTPHLRRCT